MIRKRSRCHHVMRIRFKTLAFAVLLFILRRVGTGVITQPPDVPFPERIYASTQVLKPTAWVFACFQEEIANAGITKLCMLSLCSLLHTTNPKHVVVLLDDLVEQELGSTLKSYGVTVFVVPKLDMDLIKRDSSSKWHSSKRKKRRRMVSEKKYCAKKFYAWTLTQFSKVLYFDGSDVLFVRNASNMMTKYDTFAAIKDQYPEKTGRCKEAKGYGYLNAGVMLLQPDMMAFHQLMATYLEGNFTVCTEGSGALYGDQDVITNFAFGFPKEDGSVFPPVLGAFNEWPFCFNYRGWPDQQHCAKDEIMLLHMHHDKWPISTVNLLNNLVSEGECRPTSVLF